MQIPSTQGQTNDCYPDPLRMRSFFVSGFCDTLDWRPLHLQESSVAHAACSLCGLVSRKAARLPCDHTLCSICRQESERRGSTCPLDEKSFADDDIVQLDIPQGYIEKRTVACGNAPNGCDFVGPASMLLDHYKQCTFRVVPCPRCQSSVLRTELVGHYKDGCSSTSTAPTPIQKPATLNCDRTEGTIAVSTGTTGSTNFVSSDGTPLEPMSVVTPTTKSPPRIPVTTSAAFTGSTGGGGGATPTQSYMAAPAAARPP
ncbi:hypothetical protein ISCGN_002700 [Ixodes scapularis]